ERQAVQGPLDHDGGDGGPEARAVARGHVDPDHLPGAKRQEVVAHVADEQRTEETGRARTRGKEISPAPGPRPDGGEAERDAEPEKGPPRLAQPRGDDRQVDVP